MLGFLTIDRHIRPNPVSTKISPILRIKHYKVDHRHILIRNAYPRTPTPSRFPCLSELR